MAREGRLDLGFHPLHRVLAPIRLALKVRDAHHKVQLIPRDAVLLQEHGQDSWRGHHHANTDTSMGSKDQGVYMDESQYLHCVDDNGNALLVLRGQRLGQCIAQRGQVCCAQACAI